MVILRAASAVFGLLLVTCSSPTAAPRFSEWSAPVNLGFPVNTGANEANAALSKDGLSLYFNSNRPGGFGAADLYVSQRNSVDDPWGIPVNLRVVNSLAIDSGPSLSRDGHWLFFSSNRPGGVGSLDGYASYREHVHDDFAWQPPVNLGEIVNSSNDDVIGSLFENDEGDAPQLFLGSNRPGGPGLFDFYVSTLQPDGTLGAPSVIWDLSSAAADPGLMVGFSGLEAFFFSNRSGGFGGQDLWTATRESPSDSWSVPENLGPLVNSDVTDQRPYLASDRLTLYFASDRTGNMDLYVTTRTKN
jgi:Tol biopolymer transport system component